MDPPNKRAKVDLSTDNFLSGTTIHILQAGIAKARCDIFKKQAGKFGATVVEKWNHEVVTHLIVDEKMELDRLLRILKLEAKSVKGIKIVKSLWLSTCIKSKSRHDTSDFELNVLQYIDEQERKARILEAAKVPDSAEASSSAEGLSKSVEDSGTHKESNTKFSKVGMMFGSYKKKLLGSDNDADPDSDYEPSDEEDRATAIEPSTSSKSTKYLPVSPPPP